MRRIAIDTGGTFTDCVLYDGDQKVLAVAKVPSQPKSPDRAIANGINRLLDIARLKPTDIDQVAHGTTIATNAVIQGRFARAGMITTQGCRDTLEIGSQIRSAPYNLRAEPQTPLIPRDLRIEVGGRLAAMGEEIAPLDEAAVRAAVLDLKEKGATAIAVAGLFSFANPVQEERAVEIVREVAPELYVMSSAAVSPEVREYPRFATVAANVGLAPHLDPYLSRLRGFLDAEGFTCPLLIMQSNGGVATDSRCKGDRAHHLVLSGPAGCVMGGLHLTENAGFDNLVTVDVGGTSADIGMIVKGEARTRMEMHLPNGVPLHLRHLEIETIGAGGGSIAWVDEGGALQVGPQSAGADPGPACFGITGTEPTLTDAHVVLGRLNQDRILGGEVKVHLDLARKAVGEIGEKLGLSVEQAALGIVRVADANMAGAIRGVAARNGDDLRDFALVAAGGAGALNAVDLARDLGMKAVIIPMRPGLFSAIGVLDARIRHDLVQSVLMFGDKPDMGVLAKAHEALAKKARAMLDADGAPANGIEISHQLDLRYLGQEYAVTVTITPGEPMAGVLARFHDLHDRTYGHSATGEATEIVAVRAIGFGQLGAVHWPDRTAFGDGRPQAERKVWFAETGGYVATPVYQRPALSRGQVIKGPAIIEQLDTTTVLPPDATARLDTKDNIIITLEARA
jgi:N-methylhydantoinase A